MRAAGRRYVLRRFGDWRGEAEALWEIDAVRALAAFGAPVPAPIGPARGVDGALYILMPFLAGRSLRAFGAGSVDDGRYRELGRHLAEFHALTAGAPNPAQRPGCSETVEGALPMAGGHDQRERLLAALARIDAVAARRFRNAAEALEARDLPSVFARQPRRIVQGDFAPWNIRLSAGRLVAVLDFELAHVDVRAADVAFARRGYHDAVVDGYLECSTLSDAEIAALDGLWLGGILAGLWRVIEDRLARGDLTTHGMEWDLEQLGKTRPYAG